MREFDRYLEQSRTLPVSLVASLPLLALYEIGILVTGSPVENQVSALVKRMIALFGGRAYLVLTGLVAASFVVALIVKHRGRARSFGLYWAMVLEGAVYSVILGPAIFLLRHPLAAGPSAGEFLEEAILYLGAGVWEELFFRLFLLGGIIAICTRMLGGNRVVFAALGLLVSSIAFAAIHHLGGMGEPFVAETFLFRFLAGVALGGLYVFRGLGICVYTHALYNVGLLLVTSAGV